MRKRLHKKFWKVIIEWHFHSAIKQNISKNKIQNRCRWSDKLEHRLWPKMCNIVNAMDEAYAKIIENLNEPF